MSKWNKIRTMTTSSQKMHGTEPVIHDAEEFDKELSLEEIEKVFSDEMDYWQEAFAYVVNSGNERVKRGENDHRNYYFSVVFESQAQKDVFLREIGIPQASKFVYLYYEDLKQRKARAWKPREAEKKSMRKQTEAKTQLMVELRKYKDSFANYSSAANYFTVCMDSKKQLEKFWNEVGKPEHIPHTYIDGIEFAAMYGVEVPEDDIKNRKIRGASETWIKYVM